MTRYLRIEFGPTDGIADESYSPLAAETAGALHAIVAEHLALNDMPESLFSEDDARAFFEADAREIVQLDHEAEGVSLMVFGMTESDYISRTQRDVFGGRA